MRLLYKVRTGRDGTQLDYAIPSLNLTIHLPCQTSQGRDLTSPDATVGHHTNTIPRPASTELHLAMPVLWSTLPRLADTVRDLAAPLTCFAVLDSTARGPTYTFPYCAAHSLYLTGLDGAWPSLHLSSLCCSPANLTGLDRTIPTLYKTALDYTPG